MGNSHVIFGISGSIAAYKSLDIIRQLRALDINIRPVLSESGHKFIPKWTLEVLSEHALLNNDVCNGRITHLDIAKQAQLFIICPASANTIAKLAHGHASDTLSAAFLNYSGPKLLVPAMHTDMYQNPITQKNMATLRDQGVMILPPDVGALSSGDVGEGRLPDPTVVVQCIQSALQDPINLTGKNIVVTCGGTSEAIDPVRTITNHATGLSGHALANMAAFYGAKVTLIRTTTHPTLQSIHCIQVSSANDMQQALADFYTNCDALIMNAAVSDFTVEKQATKQTRGSHATLQLTPTPDLLKTFNQHKAPHCISVGFCLSDADNLADVARKKMIDKHCDIMVANDVTAIGTPLRSGYMLQGEDAVAFNALSLETLSHTILSRMVALELSTVSG